MSETKHTPEWTYDGNGTVIQYTNPPAGKVICRLPNYGDETEELGRLIAAAPALLEACEMVDRCGAGDGVEFSEALDACLLAIAQARK